jgi:hypothetical protein
MHFNTHESQTLFINLIKQKPEAIALYLEEVISDFDKHMDFDGLRSSIAKELLPALHKAFPEGESDDGRKEKR